MARRPPSPNLQGERESERKIERVREREREFSPNPRSRRRLFQRPKQSAAPSKGMGFAQVGKIFINVS